MDNQVTVEISARHVHLSQADLETLFGKGYELTVKKMLSQPGQYASNERVRVVGTKSEFPAVSILGPVRKATQVELSKSDCMELGVKYGRAAILPVPAPASWWALPVRWS